MVTHTHFCWLTLQASQCLCSLPTWTHKTVILKRTLKTTAGGSLYYTMFSTSGVAWHPEFATPASSHEAERFAASVLEGQPCWMDRAVQVPQRSLDASSSRTSRTSFLVPEQPFDTQKCVPQEICSLYKNVYV